MVKVINCPNALHFDNNMVGTVKVQPCLQKVCKQLPDADTINTRFGDELKFIKWEIW